ncbi:PAQR family membrane homeostasis protein TrhA [Agromyces aureus]|uniref:PAQR family membrane homeostasis protein TrhA n=1 Tax=Agromyces aureus TaxID=453304 RepID=UPI0009FE9F50|nr:hemolysin III family protein [Agromyces aureus]
MAPEHHRDSEDLMHELSKPVASEDLADAAIDRDAHGPDLPNIPLLDDSLAHPTEEVKPTWRGWIHAGTFPFTIVAGIVLIALAEGAPAKWASAVFTLTSMLLFGNSALYHRFNWKPRTKLLLKRIDHANIFLLIAGTYTPLAILALPPEKGWTLLAVVWAGALIGIGFRVFWITAPRWLYVPIYLLLGWAAVMYLGDLLAVSVAMMVLVVVGGLLYSGGAIVYALKKPNPVPGVFGFHEIFHTCTVLAFMCHWTATLIIATAPAYHLG